MQFQCKDDSNFYNTNLLLLPKRCIFKCELRVELQEANPIFSSSEFVLDIKEIIHTKLY